MLRSVKLLIPTCLLTVTASSGQAKRPLAIEDYYRVLTITNPQISPDGKTVRFSVQTRVESDNSTNTETFTVPTDASEPPTKVGDPPASGPSTGSGQGGRGRGDGAGARVASPDGRAVARTQEKVQPKKEPQYASDFEKRHQERFKGVTFDWKDFPPPRSPGRESRTG